MLTVVKLKNKARDVFLPLVSTASPSHRDAARQPQIGPGYTITSERSPFTVFVLSRLDEESQKHFAIMFSENIKTNPDDRVLDFADIYTWLGFTRKGKAINLLKKEFSNREIIERKIKNPDGGRPIKQFKISINQFEQLLLAARTDAGRKYRKTILAVKTAVLEYMRLEYRTSMDAMNAAHTREIDYWKRRADGDNQTSS